MVALKSEHFKQPIHGSSTVCRYLSLALEGTRAGAIGGKHENTCDATPGTKRATAETLVVVGCGSTCSPSSPHKLPTFEKASEGWCGRRTEACFTKFLRFAPGSQRFHQLEIHRPFNTTWNSMPDGRLPWCPCGIPESLAFTCLSQGVHAVPTLRPGHRVECR